MEVRRQCQHPQAQRSRQHEAEAALQPVYGEEASRHGMRPGSSNRANNITWACPWKRGERRAKFVRHSKSFMKPCRAIVSTSCYATAA